MEYHKFVEYFGISCRLFYFNACTWYVCYWICIPNAQQPWISSIMRSQICRVFHIAYGFYFCASMWWWDGARGEIQSFIHEYFWYAHQTHCNAHYDIPKFHWNYTASIGIPEYHTLHKHKQTPKYSPKSANRLGSNGWLASHGISSAS